MQHDALMAMGRQALESFTALAVLYIPKVFMAIIVLVVGFRLTTIVVRMLERTLASQRIDRSLSGFLQSILNIIFKALVLMTVANVLGVEMTSFIALLGAIGLAVGLSLQGSLSNLAGGILILLFKPYVVGDMILAQNQQGEVVRIEMFSTLLRGEDGKTIIIPNGILSNGVIVNSTRKL